jgi:hypothetical protein
LIKRNIPEWKKWISGNGFIIFFLKYSPQRTRESKGFAEA